MVIRGIRRGHSPNCSSTGSVVGVALISAIAGAAVLNAYADRLTRFLRRGGTRPDGEPTAPDAPQDPVRVRHESFGGILAWPSPPALLYVDATTARAAEAAGALRVGGERDVPGAHRAPTEVHLAITGRCPARCTGCYLGAGPDVAPPEPGVEELRADLRRLADAGVLEVAFGGGEAGLREEVLDLADEARALGLVPNLTTSGFGIDPARARALARRFGQINVSVDGLPGTYAAVRGWEGAERALAAVDTLREAGARVGVNTVLVAANVDHLDALGDALAERGVSEWQWLRFKPAGRGAAVYEQMRLSPQQADALWPRALDIEARTGLTLRMDCALVPFVVAHLSDPAQVERLGLTGCPGGESLLARGTDGTWSPCSFAADGAAGDPREVWRSAAPLRAWRERAERPPEPCRSCRWRAVCRGGCRVVAGHVTGDPLAPDPECPRVLKAAAQPAQRQEAR